MQATRAASVAARRHPRDAAAQPRGSLSSPGGPFNPLANGRKVGGLGTDGGGVGTRSFSTLPPPPRRPFHTGVTLSSAASVGSCALVGGSLSRPGSSSGGGARALPLAGNGGCFSERDATAQSHKAAAAVISSRRMREPRRTLSR